MPLGKTVRGLLPAGTETLVADSYRRMFIDLEDLGRTLSRLGPVDAVAEIGCGDGAMTTQLAAVFPEASIHAIDVSAAPGELFEGDDNRVLFESRTAQSLADEQAGNFCLVVLVDVLHHVPLDERVELIATCRRLLRDGGFLVIKEWEQRANVAGLMATASDRFITGDKNVRFWSRAELLEAVDHACPEAVVVLEARVPPHRNNLLLAMRATR